MSRRKYEYILLALVVIITWCGFLISHMLLLAGVNSLLMKEATKLQAATNAEPALNLTATIANLDDSTIAIGFAKDVQLLAAVAMTITVSLLLFMMKRSHEGPSQMSRAADIDVPPSKPSP